jgi:hypothetical protein
MQSVTIEVQGIGIGSNSEAPFRNTEPDAQQGDDWGHLPAAMGRKLQTSMPEGALCPVGCQQP